jgi:hypothetical protein
VSLEQARLNLSLAKPGLEAAQHALDKMTLRAPFGGSVVSVEPQARRMPGQMMVRYWQTWTRSKWERPT